MGRSRTTHAGVASTEKQARFVRLIEQGVNNSEACRQVGINRRTGTRWRFGRTVQNTAGVDVHYAPVRSVTPSTRHPRYLSLDERTVIADLRRARWTLRDIADELGRSPSTISRELRRNAADRGRYLPATADRAAVERIARPRARRVAADAELQAVVVELLGNGGARSRSRTSCLSGSPASRHRQLCTESIYQAIYDPAVPVTRPAKRRRRRRRRRRAGP